MSRVWDISPSVSPASPVFPGDTPYSQQWVAQIGPDAPVNVSAITLSPHVGAHADAPLHYGRNGAAAGQLDLDPFLGPCRVIHVIGRGPLIVVTDVASTAGPVPPRLLVRTRARALTSWSNDFTAFAPATIAWLAQAGVRLVGIDTPSVDPAGSKTLDSHRQLLAHDMRVLENLVLDDVAAGDYELIALPLKQIGRAHV